MTHERTTAVQITTACRQAEAKRLMTSPCHARIRRFPGQGGLGSHRPQCDQLALSRRFTFNAITTASLDLRAAAVLAAEGDRKWIFVTNGTDSAPAALAHPRRSPLSTSARHPYRHGVVPTLGTGLPNLGVNNLRYGGGTNGVGVMTGGTRVYPVFQGSQWGRPAPVRTPTPPWRATHRTNTAPVLQGFFMGLGTSGESR